ncbi:E2 family protein D [Paenibacillus sp. yr247]|uniref:hypothetical protein n=1 Tax=Paenibacillus sp. yr247 TaxID=1761880 RepID=UPI00088860E5|nr:hypothetical protein [Paenibacillus sp. yr247]SDO17918.1 E2 family protein D [Paenibacillus sp. yr247]
MEVATMREEYRIVLPNDSTKLARLLKVVNGIEVDSKRILIGELILSLLEQLDDHLLIDYLLRDGKMKDLFEEIVTFAHEHEPDQLAVVMERILSYATDEPTSKMVRAILGSIAESHNLAKLDEEQLVSVLSSLLRTAGDMKNKQVLERTYLELLKRVSLFDSPDANLLSNVITCLLTHTKQFTDDQMEQLNAMFLALSKKVSREALVEAARPHLADQKLSSPVLPKNCAFFEQYGNGKMVVGIEVEKGQHDVVFGDQGQTVYEKVGYPRLLFWFSLYNGKAEGYVAAVKDAILKDSTELFRFPYSNVNQSGLMCWPTLKQHTIQDLRQLETLPFVFLGAPKNMDLYVSIQGMNLRDLLDRMQHQDFNDDLLVPTNKTIGDLLKSNN